MHDWEIVRHFKQELTWTLAGAYCSNAHESSGSLKQDGKGHAFG